MPPFTGRAPKCMQILSQISTIQKYGMHPNADLTFQMQGGMLLLETLSDNQRVVVEAKVDSHVKCVKKAGQLRERTPADFR